MSWTSRQTRAQYFAVLRLRWRMYLNGFRRKGGAANLVATILVAPFAVALVVGLMSAAGFSAGAIAASGNFARLSLVFWGIFIVTQLFNLQFGQSGVTFDPTQLVRFPMSPANYTAIRLFFGIVSPGNVIVTLCSLAAAAGIIVVQPSLWFWALAAAVCFAVVNTIFSRMIFSWVDRWLATRRAREIYTVLIIAFSLGIQWANFAFNPAYQKHDRQHHQSSSVQIERAREVYHHAQPFLILTPPALTASAILDGGTGKPAGALGALFADLAYAVVFFAVFARRMGTEYRGENLSDEASAASAHASTKAALLPRRTAPVPIAGILSTPVAQSASKRDLLTVLIGKEFLYLRRNLGLFYSVVSPLIAVFIFTSRFARGNAQWALPAALAFGLLGVFPTSYNSFGLDGVGTQLYFLAPVRIRDILLAKNVLNSFLAMLESILVIALVTYLSGLPSLLLVCGSLLWALATLCIELTIGNYRSLAAPKRIDSSKPMQKQANQASAYMSMGVLAVSAALGWALLTLGHALPSLAWVFPLSMLVFAAVAVAIYWHNLNTMDIYAMRRRDDLFEELGRKA